MLNTNDGGEALLRSSAVAQLVPMPVATLRIWEQRYQAVRPRTMPSGHRRYSAADVVRLRCLRRLVAQGHAIGAIASLDTARLQQLLAPPGGEPVKVLVVGAALGARLLRPASVAALPAAYRLVAVLETLEDAVALARRDACDLLVWHCAGLDRQRRDALQALQTALPQLKLGVVYGYAGAAMTAAFEETGATLLRDAGDDHHLTAWLASLASAARPDNPPRPHDALRPPVIAATPARYDEATLAALMAMAQPMACECPRHLAELLLRLTQFGHYSGACRDDHPSDAAVHAEVQQAVASARALLETALSSTIRHAGLRLPGGDD